VKLGYTERELEEMKVTFYSGRHYWKTVMSAEGLGEDVEELFMGHKDKRGLERMLASAREIFEILDRMLFSLQNENAPSR
jgi:integrase